jgi:hypothetical protein
MEDRAIDWVPVTVTAARGFSLSMAIHPDRRWLGTGIDPQTTTCQRQGRYRAAQEPDCPGSEATALPYVQVVPSPPVHPGFGPSRAPETDTQQPRCRLRREIQRVTPTSPSC